jgi:hypothetical protein
METNGKHYAPLPGKIPGAAINLGGHDFVLAPLGLRLLREYQAKAHALAEKKDPPATPDELYELNVEVIVASLNRNYPEITREGIEELLDSVNVPESLALIWDQSGVKRVKPGELKPGG